MVRECQCSDAPTLANKYVLQSTTVPYLIDKDRRNAQKSIATSRELERRTTRQLVETTRVGGYYNENVKTYALNASCPLGSIEYVPESVSPAQRAAMHDGHDAALENGTTKMKINAIMLLIIVIISIRTMV